jgi:protein-S-isoprenylcysteine O-methyltransferase Ste14
VNALAAVALIALAGTAYLNTRAYASMFGPAAYADFKWPVLEHGAGGAAIVSRVLLHLPNQQVALWAMFLYSVIYAVWYLVFGSDRPGKATLAVLAVFKLLRRPLDPAMTPNERAAAMNVAVKLTFAPLMTIWVVSSAANVMNAVGNSIAFRDLPPMEWYWRHAHWALFWILLSVDTLWFWCGYLVELPRLRNTIRSVEPTALGWVVALACYPALNAWTGQLLGWYASDQPQVLAHFGDAPAAQLATVILGLAVVFLMAIFAWASVSLGFKASNLTNRGTVSDGPYRWVRHPAYASKNAAWIVSGMVPLAAALWKIPWSALGAALAAGQLADLTGLVQHAWSHVAQAATIALSLAAWAFIYHLRSLTEERHLGLDAEYRAYCARVRWRYVPGLY